MVLLDYVLSDARSLHLEKACFALIAFWCNPRMPPNSVAPGIPGTAACRVRR